MIDNVYRGPSPVSAFAVKWAKFPLPDVNDVIFCSVRDRNCYRFDKQGFADLLKVSGPDVVRKRFDLASTKFNPVLWLKLNGMEPEVPNAWVSYDRLLSGFDTFINRCGQNYLYVESSKATQLEPMAEANQTEPTDLPASANLVSAKRHLASVYNKGGKYLPLTSLMWRGPNADYYLTAPVLEQLFAKAKSRLIHEFFSIHSNYALRRYLESQGVKMPRKHYWLRTDGYRCSFTAKDIEDFLEPYRIEGSDRANPVPNTKTAGASSKVRDKGLEVVEEVVVPTTNTSGLVWHSILTNPTTSGIKLVCVPCNSDEFTYQFHEYTVGQGWDKPDINAGNTYCWADINEPKPELLSLKANISLELSLDQAAELYNALTAAGGHSDLLTQLQKTFPVLSKLTTAR